MPGYLIQSLNSSIDLMIQHKYKNWIEVWRFFFDRTLLLFIRFSSEMCFLSEIFPSEVAFLSECCSFCVSGFPQKSSDFLQESSSFCQISLQNLLLFVRFPSEISFMSGFPQKFSFCQVSFRKLLLSEVRNILLYVRFSLNISFFSVRYFLLSVRFPSEILFLSKISFMSGFPRKSPAFLELK